MRSQKQHIRRVLCAAYFLTVCSSVSLAVNIDLVSIGGPNNPGNPYFGGKVGSVPYVFSMGKYEITAGQYTEFLNAVAATDTYGLYSSSMDTASNSFGCNIKRSGSPGSYSYSVPSDWANRPVNSVCWGDALRFANWLTNGQPRGEQGLSTTEDGSYYLNGVTSSTQFIQVVRKPNAKFVLPNWDEWNKAAYYDPSKPGGPGYWYLPTRSDSASNVLSATASQSANFFWHDTYTIGAPYWRTEVGSFAGSPGPWGTFDQGGNVDEWNERLFSDGKSRVIVGGGYSNDDFAMHIPSYTNPAAQFSTAGFRVAFVPEPGNLTLIAFALLVTARRDRCTDVRQIRVGQSPTAEKPPGQEASAEL